MAASGSVARELQHVKKTVELESWPAQPIKPAPSSLSLADRDKTDQTLSIPPPPPGPKPKFLQQLEKFLQKELRLLGCPPIGPHPLRLQAHREVFEYLIEDFKTYKPLLSTIKTEYELYIDHLHKKIASLEPLSGEMDVVREECERQLLAVGQEERRAEAEVEVENKRLLRVIDTLRSKENDYQRQVEKLQDGVGQLYQQYRDESDARKLLVADYNELKLQQAQGEEGGGGDVSGAEDEMEDPTVLKLKLVRTREDLRLANQRITGMVADYSDVVPRREFERIETACKVMEEDLETVKNDHDTLINEHRILQSVHEGVVEERDRARSSLSHLRGTATPRPEWSRCHGFVEGWAESSVGQSSDQLVDLLLAGLTGKSLEEIIALSGFQGQGLGEDVPRYLRWEGHIPNHRLSQTQINSLIDGFWKHCLSHSDIHSLVVEESVWEYLLSVSDEDEQTAIENAYNLQDAVSRMKHEPHIALYSSVLEGKVRLETVHQWISAQDNLLQSFSQQQTNEGVIRREMVKEVVEKVFPGKPAIMINQLVSCITTAPPPHNDTVNDDNSEIHFTPLLTPDDRGRPSELVLLLLDQQRMESQQFLSLITSNINQSCSEVTLTEMETAVITVDPSFPPSLLHTLLTPLYSDPGLSLPLSLVISHLTACGITRHSPP